MKILIVDDPVPFRERSQRLLAKPQPQPHTCTVEAGAPARLTLR
jgi:hypothetical protein